MRAADALAARITAAPRAHDPARGAAAAELLGASGAAAELVAGAAGSSPYLARLIEREADWARAALDAEPGAALAAACAAPGEAEGARALASRLREAKRRVALLAALADLGGVWDLDETTAALTRFADAALAAAMDFSVREATGPLAACGTAADAGLVALAMGKMGAHELNYSSDIDLIFLFDEERWGVEAAEARAKLAPVARRVVKLLSEIDAEGYVFRTDLRLRPNPASTPVVISMAAAEAYYESVGRTWERAAFIKARAAAGDIAAGRRFLDTLIPFVWRRHLDFAAIEDAHEMRLKIRDHKGVGRRFEIAGHDVKLGLGGIREIEFFAQTQQLVRGGRDPSLRDPTTRGALRALSAAGVLDAATRAALDDHYVAHRTLEHRLQMIEDAQTQTMPVAPEARARVAALGGWESRAAMEAEVERRCLDVRARCDAFFAPRKAQDGPLDAAAFAELGYGRPEAAAALVERWLSGAMPATRTERARRRLARLAPLIAKKLAEAGDPDEAIAEFDRFLSGLPAGVQLFALCEANPQLLDLLAEICAAAPRLAGYLGRHSGVLDGVLDRSFFAPVADAATLRAELEAVLARAPDYEARLDAARRWAKERRFRIGVQTLRGVASAPEAGAGFSAVAEACLAALHPVVTAAFASRHGPPPGRGACVLALGKLGAREMTATSDLDLIVICDPGDDEESAGPKPLPQAMWFARWTQMLIAALTAPTAEGALYAVDMRLRPSGRSGPVAVRLSAFDRYQREEAWTWEHLALTRARGVAGAPAVLADAEAVAAQALAAPHDRARTLADVREMRGKLAEAHKARRAMVWELKHAEGGLMDVALAVQAGQLVAGLGAVGPPDAAALKLAEAGWLAREDAEALAGAHRLMMALQQIERVALDRPFDPATAGPGLRAAMARAAGAADFAQAEARLAAAQARAAEAVARVLGA